MLQAEEIDSRVETVPAATTKEGAEERYVYLCPLCNYNLTIQVSDLSSDNGDDDKQFKSGIKGGGEYMDKL